MKNFYFFLTAICLLIGNYSLQAREEKAFHPPLDRAAMPQNPMKEVKAWVDEAYTKLGKSAYIAAMATSTPSGIPSLRMMRCLSIDPTGILIHGSKDSMTFKSLGQNPEVELCFYWYDLNRQLRLYGLVKPASEAMLKKYFSQMDRDHQIAAWASKTGQTSLSKKDIEKKFNEYQEKFEGQAVPVPDHWGIYEVIPTRIIFWQTGTEALDERVMYERKTKNLDEPIENAEWHSYYLNP